MGTEGGTSPSESGGPRVGRRRETQVLTKDHVYKDVKRSGRLE